MEENQRGAQKVSTRKAGTELGGPVPRDRKPEERSLSAGIPERQRNTEYMERIAPKNVLQLTL